MILVKNTDLIEVKLKTELVLSVLIAEIIAYKDETFFKSKRNQKKILSFFEADLKFSVFATNC